MKPTVGRIIHVFDAYTSDGTHANLLPSPLAAIVTEAPAGVEIGAEGGGSTKTIGVTVFLPPNTGPLKGPFLSLYLAAEPRLRLANLRGTYWDWPAREEG